MFKRKQSVINADNTCLLSSLSVITEKTVPTPSKNLNTVTSLFEKGNTVFF